MRKTTLLALLVIASLVALGCGKKDKDKKDVKKAPPAEVKKPVEPPKEPVKPKASVELTDNAAQNLIAVFEHGVKLVTDNKADPAKAAAAVQALLKEYDVADLRAKSKAAKEAGEGASDEDKAKFTAAKEAYGKLATEIGAKDEAFNAVHKEWSAAWGLN